MNNYVVKWLSTKGIVSMLGYSVVGRSIYYQHAEFIGREEIYYRFNMVNTDDRILGSLNTTDTLRIESPLGFDSSASSSMVQRGLFTGFDPFLTKYETFEDFRDAKPRKISEADMDSITTLYHSRIVNKVKMISHSIFDVQDAYVNNDALYVFFSIKERIEYPIKLRIGEPSVVENRNYGKYCDQYREFVSLICENTGELIWR